MQTRPAVHPFPDLVDAARRVDGRFARALPGGRAALIDAGADLNLRDRQGNTPLQLARVRGHSRMVTMLEQAARTRTAEPAK